MGERYYDEKLGNKFSGDDDLDDLKNNGKGLVVRGGMEGDTPSWTSKRYYCVNCRKGIHNTRDNQERCRAKGCECKCQYCYIGRDGRARPYKKMLPDGRIVDNPDDSDLRENTTPLDPAKDKIYDELNARWREVTSERPVDDKKD